MAVLLNWRPQYGIPFYLQYLAHWPEYFIVAEAPGGELMGYSECPRPGPAAPGPQRSAGAPAALGPGGGRAASGAELRARSRASLRPPRASPGPGSLALPCRGDVRQQYPLLGQSAGSPSSLSLPRHPGRPLQRLGKWPVRCVEA